MCAGDGHCVCLSPISGLLSAVVLTCFLLFLLFLLSLLHCFAFSFFFTLNNLFICIGGLCYSHVHSFIQKLCVCWNKREALCQSPDLQLNI
mgnify:CR=1 FL=1